MDYIYSKMDSQMWKPFLFEIMILVGKAYGTNDALFIQLFTQEKAYLMGRCLTVESRLKSFKDSRLPFTVTQYYTEAAYKKMLLALSDLLIQHNEQAFFTQLINDQARFYLCKELVVKGLESSCRHFRPKMAILLACISIQEDLEYNFSDYANLMPDLEAVVTMKDVQQTAMIVKSMNKQWSAKTLIKKVR